jgi:seryl-tRNA synthetase
MLDIKFIRDNRDLVVAAANKKKAVLSVDALLSLDDRRRELTKSIEIKRAEQNFTNDQIAAAGPDRDSLIVRMKELKQTLQREEAELVSVLKDWQTLMLAVPNIPDVSVPDGNDEKDNQEVKVWGDKPLFNFSPKSHVELMTALHMLDLERGSKVSGFRGYFLKGDAVRLTMAIWQLAFKFFSEKGFEPLIVPSLVRRETLLGSGYLPQGEDDLYRTQDGDFLAGTGEVAVMSYFAGEVLPHASLPKKLLAFSPCFRREAGSHGKDTKGIMRVHEFFKFEQVVLCEANHTESVKYHEWLNRNTEEFFELLGLPYRTVVNCGADLGLGQVKKYDIELWVPSEKAYREIGSTSYFHDFQTRRLNIRYKEASGKMTFVHSLNATALPVPRALVSLIENNQREDGSIVIPKALREIFGRDLITGRNQ